MKDIRLICSQINLIKALAKGLTLQDTANYLGINYFNLQKRTQNLYKLFEVHNRSELIKKALKIKVISTKDITKKFRKRFLQTKNDNSYYNLSFNMELTPLEINYLFLAASGFNEKIIRKILNLEGKYHSASLKKTILWKLNVNNLTQAIVKAYKLGNI